MVNELTQSLMQHCLPRRAFADFAQIRCKFMKTGAFLLLLNLYAFPLLAQEVKPIRAGELKAFIDSSTGPTIVNFWATWCAPCLEEIPHFNELQRLYPGRLQLIFVSMDFRRSYPALLNAFVKKNELKGQLYWLDETDADYFCPVIDSSWSGAIPATIFINNTTKTRRFMEKQLSPEEINREAEKIMQRNKTSTGFINSPL